MTRIEIAVPTAHCGSCRAEILQLLEGLPGLADVNVDLADRFVRATLDPAVVASRDVEVALAIGGHPPAAIVVLADDESGRTPDPMSPQAGSNRAPTPPVHGVTARSGETIPTPTGADHASTHPSHEDDLP